MTEDFSYACTNLIMFIMTMKLGRPCSLESELGSGGGEGGRRTKRYFCVMNSFHHLLERSFYVLLAF